MLEDSETGSPFWNVMNDLTISGLPLSLSDVPNAEELGWVLWGYQETVLDCLGHAGFPTEAEFSALLAEVEDCEDVGDCPHDPERQLLLDVALAFRFIDEAAKSLRSEVLSFRTLLVWNRMADAVAEANGRRFIEAFSDGALARKRLATIGAKAKHALSAYAGVKQIVRECFDAWEANPSHYKDNASFARAMLDKFPDVLRSEVTVTRWARYWRQEKE